MLSFGGPRHYVDMMCTVCQGNVQSILNSELLFRASTRFCETLGAIRLALHTVCELREGKYVAGGTIICKHVG